MGRMAEFEDRVWSAGRGYLSKGGWQGGEHKFRESAYRNSVVLVEIYEWLDRERRQKTHMRFAWQGQEFARWWEHGFGDRTLSRLAREFVEEKTGLKING